LVGDGVFRRSLNGLVQRRVDAVASAVDRLRAVGVFKLLPDVVDEVRVHKLVGRRRERFGFHQGQLQGHLLGFGRVGRGVVVEYGAVGLRAGDNAQRPAAGHTPLSRVVVLDGDAAGAVGLGHQAQDGAHPLDGRFAVDHRIVGGR